MSGLEGRTIGEFKILTKIGHGAMGTVYLAEQPALKRSVALKILLPELARDLEYANRFKREAMLAASLNHPNIVQVYAAGQSDDIHYIAMEYVDGESLERRMAREGRIKPAVALSILMHLTKALDNAWQKARLIHRDIKPSNVLISMAGEVKLVDFGLAKSVGGESTLTATGMLVGTPLYISPEQARGDDEVDFSTDIYSLGCTLYHMLCGRAPFNAHAPFAIVLQHVTKPMPSILELMPDCPPAIVRLINRMVAKKTGERPASYAELTEELHRVENSLTAPPRTSRRSLAIVAVVIVAALSWFSVKKWPSPVAPPARSSDNADNAGTAGSAARLGEDAFVKAVAAQPAEAQARRVINKLKELNPDFDPATAAYSIEDGAVAELALGITAVSDLSPVRALTSLKRLRLGQAGQTGVLESLEALHGLSLTRLECYNAPVSDLTPLRGMPLTRFICSGSRTRITDLTPLHDSPLEALGINETGVSDLAPLRGLPLKLLNCGVTQVSDLTPLEGMPLTDLNCSYSMVRDLSPLAGMALTRLVCSHASIEDLSPLRGMPLKDLDCDFNARRDEDILRSIPTLEKINGLPAAEFWKVPGSSRFQ